MLKVERIVFRGSLVYETLETPLAIPRNWVLLETIVAGVTSFENSIAQGRVWLSYNRVPGWSGVGRVVEVGVDAPAYLRGRLVVPALFNKNHIPGMDFNGFLSTYVSIPYSSIEPVNASDPIKAYLSIHAGIASKVLEKTGEGSILIIGGGPVGQLVFEGAKGVKELIACGRKKIGVPQDLRKWDTVFVSSLRRDVLRKTFRKIERAENIILHPLVYALYDEIPVTPGARIIVPTEIDVKKGLELIQKIKPTFFKDLKSIEGLKLSLPVDTTLLLCVLKQLKE